MAGSPGSVASQDTAASQDTVARQTSVAGPVIRCSDVSRSYALGGGMVHALRNVNLEIASGDFIAIMGPSGSGKSTLMNLIGCLDSPSSGKIFIDGADVSDLKAPQLAAIRSRRIGFVFQQFNLLRRTTAEANVGMPLLYATHIRREERQQRARRCLDLVGLSQRMDHQPSQLSGGQQQRVAIARALVNDPAIVLADEPTGALDSRTGMEILDLFQQLNRHGITMVVVTHDADVAAAARRVISFRDGRLVEDRINAHPRDMAAELALLPTPDDTDSEESGAAA